MNCEEVMTDANVLYKAYLASAKGSKWKESTQRFVMNYLKNIFSIQEDLRNRTLKNGSQREFILCERGRIRPITSIPIRDRVIRHALCDDILMPKIRKRIIYDNGFKVDVSYMNDEEYKNCIANTFNKNSYRNIPKTLLTGEKYMEKSVNIGDQLSQTIGIYYPHPIDNYVKTIRSQKFYGRYMDDWYIMNPNKTLLNDILEKIDSIAKTLGIHINHKKTRIVKISSTYKFLQIKYSLTKTGKVIKRINPRRVTVMRRKLKKLALKVQNLEIDYERIEHMFKGWMGSFYKILSRKQRKNLIQLYEGLFNKSVNVANKKLIIVDRPI